MALGSAEVASICLNSGIAFSAEILFLFCRPKSSSTSRPDNGLVCSRPRFLPLTFGGTWGCKSWSLVNRSLLMTYPS